MQESDIRAMRLIHLAILLGALVFGGVVFVIRVEDLLPDLDGSDETAQLISWVAGGMAVVMVLTGFVVRTAMFGRLAGADETLAPQLYRGGHLVFLAVLEGAILFNLVALLLGAPWPLNGGVAIALWFIQAISWPSLDQFQSLRH